MTDPAIGQDEGDLHRTSRTRAHRELVRRQAVGLLAEAYGLEPYIDSDGRLGMQFTQFGLDVYYSDQTLFSEIDGLIDVLGMEQGIGPAALPELLRWQETLSQALARVESQIAEVKLAPNASVAQNGAPRSEPVYRIPAETADRTPEAAP